MSLEQYLESLADDERPLRNADLMQLSDLTSEDLRLVASVWRDIDAGRRRDLLVRLIDLSEENLEAEFSDLFRHCLGDENPEVRAKAIEGLWECDERTLVTPLIALLGQDPFEEVRAAAATALGKFALLSQTGKLLQKDRDRIKQSLMRSVLDGDETLSVRRRAMEAVAPFNTDDVQSVIQDAYRSPVKGMRCSAVYAMGKSCDSRWLPTILAELQNTDAAMRYEASNACGELGEEPAVPHLIPLFEDDDHLTQISAITAVGNIGGNLARKALLRCIKSADDVASEAAQEALDNLDASERTFDTDPYAPRSAR
ncbi:MAG: HEAT repeat domain-containing protein [Chloroflexota bacterium]|nr:HEAT repeat domain-containing protein [Chloroflexota bacterium]MDE2941092.1 HEAT repeat domain-containing protein [Chloroflexota bacterium]MDE3267382.1 HEAT repeat domain-containing protein [Chloroflexota bacterium]